MNARPTITIVVPAKNEERALGHTLQALPLSTLRAMGFEPEVVVLDGSSTDRTAEIARSLGATVLQDREPGKGAALRNARPHFKGEFVVMLDGDGTYATDAIPRAVARLAYNGADVVMGRRVVQPGAMTGVHKVGNVALTVLARTLYMRRCPDVCTGLWAFRADVLRRMPLKSRGFGLEAELFAFAARLDLRIEEVAVDYLPRRGHSKVSAMRDGARIARRLLVSRFVPLHAAGMTAHALSPLAQTRAAKEAVAGEAAGMGAQADGSEPGGAVPPQSAAHEGGIEAVPVAKRPKPRKAEVGA